MVIAPKRKKEKVQKRALCTHLLLTQHNDDAPKVGLEQLSRCYRVTDVLLKIGLSEARGRLTYSLKGKIPNTFMF